MWTPLITSSIEIARSAAPPSAVVRSSVAARSWRLPPGASTPLSAIRKKECGAICLPVRFGVWVESCQSTWTVPSPGSTSSRMMTFIDSREMTRSVVLNSSMNSLTSVP